MSRTKKAQELKTITDLVKKLLEEIPECRENDDILYMNVVKKIAPDVLMMPVYLFFVWRKENNYRLLRVYAVQDKRYKQSIQS